MKKKLLALSAIIIAVLCALCLSACRRNKKPQTVYDSSGVVYELSYNDTAYTVSDCSDVTEVEILSECNGLPVISIDANAFRGCQALTDIKIPATITSIEHRAFYNCGNLKSVTIPSGVTSIENETFYGCRGLESIEIPNSVTRIGNRAFQYCSGLESVDIPSGVVAIGDSAFQYCEKLKSITIPKNVTEIGSSSFADCVGLTSIEVASSVTSVGQDAFQDSINITEAIVPTNALSSIPKDNLQTLVINGGSYSMRSYMFNGCSKLTSLTVSSSIIVIETNVVPYIDTAVIYCDATKKPLGWSLHWCDDAQPVVWDCNNNDKDEDGYAYTVVDGIRYRLRDGEAAVIRQPKDTVGEITIPAYVIYKDSAYNVTAVGNGVFYGCRGLTGVTLPPNIVTIGSSAFSDCQSLKKIVFGGGLKSIGSYAFYNCSELTDIEIPSGVTDIGIGAFDKCVKLTSIKIPDGVTSISEYAFARCECLTEIMIPSSVTTIGDNAFQGCVGLVAIQIPSSVTTIGDGAFQGCVGLTSVKLPSALTDIGSYAFQDCENLKSIIMHGGVPKNIIYAFDGTQLVEVYFIGTEAQYLAIQPSNNDEFRRSTVYYYSESQPSQSGNYWHYAADWVTPEKW